MYVELGYYVKCFLIQFPYSVFKNYFNSLIKVISKLKIRFKSTFFGNATGQELLLQQYCCVTHCLKTFFNEIAFPFSVLGLSCLKWPCFFFPFVCLIQFSYHEAWSYKQHNSDSSGFKMFPAHYIAWNYVPVVDLLKKKQKTHWHILLLRNCHVHGLALLAVCSYRFEK